MRANKCFSVLNVQVLMATLFDLLIVRVIIFRHISCTLHCMLSVIVFGFFKLRGLDSAIMLKQIHTPSRTSVRVRTSVLCFKASNNDKL